MHLSKVPSDVNAVREVWWLWGAEDGCFMDLGVQKGWGMENIMVRIRGGFT